jgi:hypothetical protein
MAVQSLDSIRRFVARSIDRGGAMLVSRTFPLAQALGAPTLDAWRSYLAEVAAEGAGGVETGCVAVEDGRNLPFGLFRWRVERASLGGANLVCDPFVYLEIYRQHRPVAEMVAAAEGIAMRHACDWLSVVAAVAVGDKPHCGCGDLGEHAFERQGVVLRKRIGAARLAAANREGD